MKLRIRLLETQETQRIEVTIPCSLRRLKELIALAFSSSSSLSSPPHVDSIRLSLNRKDEIQSSSPDEDTLQSLGITSGDLVFVTLNPNGFHIITNFHQGQEPTSIIKPQQNLVPVMSKTAGSIPNLYVNLPVKAYNQPESSNTDRQTEEMVEDEMEVDDINDEGYALEAVGSSFSVPSFLKNVFSTESDKIGVDNHKLLIVAIHAVLLESGFIGYDMDLKNEVKGFQFRSNWPQNTFLLSLFYTLPGIIGHVYPSSEHKNGVVVLKFQMTGNVVNVYGSLCSPSSRTYLLRLNVDYLVPFLNVVWANCGLYEKIASKDGTSFTSSETEVYNFWRNAKDKLALPLLIDLCDRAGLVLPACFMRLPTDLKLKILESLPGDDIAKVTCVCSELRYLASNDDLWKLKFVEQFDDVGSSNEKGIWKSKFGRRWLSKKKKKRGGFRHPQRMMIDPRTRLPPVRRIIGGDYDLWPQNFPPYHQFGLPSGRRMSGSHIPRCNWNGNV